MEELDDVTAEDFLIAAVCESRSREVAIVCMSTLRTHLLQTYLIQDSQSYQETCDTLLTLKPKEVLLADSTRRRPLTEKIAGLATCVSAPGAVVKCLRVIYVARNYFDQDRGAELVKRLSLTPVDQDMLEKYVFLASSHALLKYLEATANVRFTPSCLRIEFECGGYGGRLVIDRKTAKDLELISNVRTGSQKDSLFGLINRTKTPLGGRNLKANLLQPLTDMTTINTRLDLVELLLSTDSTYLDGVTDLLAGISDLDKMLAGIAAVPVKEDLNAARRLVDTVVLLKTTLEILPAVVDQLEQIASDAPAAPSTAPNHDEPLMLLRAVMAALSPPAFAEISQLIGEYICESTIHERSIKTRRLQECFAIQAGVCGLLDVARKTFLQSVEDIYDLASKYSTQYGIDTIQVKWSTSKGYFLSFPATTLSALPDVFIQHSVVRKSLQCTTQELSSLSRRAEEAASQCIILTNSVLRENLMGSIQVHIDTLFKAVEAIALLDMLFGFADLVLSAPSTWTRPKIFADGPMAIKGGRHPIISMVSDEPFVPNSTYTSPFNNMVIMTGVNGSGKTTLLKQTALITILAQIGCFVPAEEAVIPIRDRVLSSLSTADDMETNLSTFMSEMRTAAYVCEHATPRSLIVIDELGRGTSTQDGAALSFAVVETLLVRKAYTFFSTHYRQLLVLPQLYGNVKLVHLKASLKEAEGGRSLTFEHKATEGASEIESGYGLAMAAMVGLPENVLKEAERVKMELDEREQESKRNRGAAAATSAQHDREDPLWQYNVMKRLVMVAHSAIRGSALRDFLQGVRSQITPAKTNDSQTGQ